jgi:hypothetical protein
LEIIQKIEVDMAGSRYNREDPKTAIPQLSKQVSDILDNNAKVDKRIIVLNQNINKYGEEAAYYRELTAGYFEAIAGDFEYLSSREAYLQNLRTEVLNAGFLDADSAFIKKLDADLTETKQLLATKANIDDLNATNAEITNLKTDKANVSDLNAANAEIEALKTDKANVSDLNATNAEIETLKTDKADIDDLNATNAEIDDLKAKKANVSDLTATNAEIDNLKTQKADIDLANVENAYIDHGVFNTAAIVDEQVFKVTGNKATIDTINAANINVVNLNAKNLKIETADGYVLIGDKKTPTKEYLDDLTEELNDRIDGAIETFTSTAVPTLTNYPANQWGTDEVKATHVGDVCYVVNDTIAQNGYCYRFTLNGTTFSWQLIKDSDVTAALQRLQTAEGKIGNIEAFDEEIATFKTETEGEISTLQTKTTNLETSLGDKVDKTTFNEVSQKVDENSASITTLETNVTKKADSSTVTTLSNTVNTVKQTADANKESITSLTQAVEKKADGSTVSTLSEKVNTVEQTANGNKTSISNLSKTVEKKADSSTVTTLSGKVNTIEETVDGHAQSISDLESTVETKADGSTVSTLSEKVNVIKNTADTNKASITSLTKKVDDNETDIESKYSTLSQSVDNFKVEVGETYITGQTDYYLLTTSDETVENAKTRSLKRASGDVVHVTDAIDAPMDQLEVSLSPIQDLHGCDHPWVGGAGKNKWNPQGYTGLGYNVNDGTTVTLTEAQTTIEDNAIKYTIGAWGYRNFRTNALPAGEYHVHFDATRISNPRISIYTVGSDNVIKRHINMSTAEVIDSTRIVEDGDYLVAYIGTNTAQDMVITSYQIEIGTTATAWTPYENICPISGWDSVEAYVSPTQSKEDGTTHTATFDETVYGGTVDLVSGVLTVDRAYVDLGTLTWSRYGATSSYDRFISSGIDSSSKQLGAVVCSAFKSRQGNEAITPNMIWLATGNGRLSITVDLGVYSDADAFKTAMSGVQLVYELATPRTIQLDPQTITTLVGVNNVWADSGDVSLGYVAENDAEWTTEKQTPTELSPYVWWKYKDKYGNGEFYESAPTLFNSYPDDMRDKINKSISTFESRFSVEPEQIAANISAVETSTKSYTDGKITQEVTDRNSAISAKADEITTSVSKTYQTKSDMSAYPTTTSMNSAINQKAGEITTSVSSTYETKTDATSKLNTAKGYTDDEITSAKADIKVTTDGISTEVSKKTDKDSIISTIRQSAETVKIKASQVEIDGTATFNAIKANTDAAYDANGAAAAAEANAKGAIPTKVSQLTNDSKFQTENQVNNAVSGKANKSDAVSEEQYIYISKASGTTSVSSTTTWVTEAGDKQNTWTTKRPTYDTSYPVLFVAKQKKVVSGTVTCTTPVKDDTTTIIDGGHITTGTIDSNRLNADTIKVNAGNIQGSLTIGQLPSTVAETSDIPTKVSQLTNDSKFQTENQVENTVTGKGYQTANQVSNAVTNGVKDKADKSDAVSEEQYIYISKASGTSSVSGTTTWITETGDKQNTWTTKRPTYNASYPVLFVAKQKKVVSGTVTCTTPVKDDTTTVIDGGHITTGTIDASKVTVKNIDASKITVGNHFYADGSGVHVTQNASDASTQGKNVLIDEDGLTIRDGSTKLASFGSTKAIIGKEDEIHAEINTSGFEVRNPDPDGDDETLYMFKASGGGMEICGSHGLELSGGGVEPYNFIEFDGRMLSQGIPMDGLVTKHLGSGSNPQWYWDIFAPHERNDRKYTIDDEYTVRGSVRYDSTITLTTNGGNGWYRNSDAYYITIPTKLQKANLYHGGFYGELPHHFVLISCHISVMSGGLAYFYATPAAWTATQVKFYIAHLGSVSTRNAIIMIDFTGYYELDDDAIEPE